MTYEFDLNLYRIDRDVYSVLDWIGDVGGLFEGLVILFSALVALANFNSLDHYLIEGLYKKQPLEDMDPDSNKKLSKSDYDVNLRRQRTWMLRQKFDSCLTAACKRIICCNFLRLSREERMFAQARDHFVHEVDIVQFLKKVRRHDAFYQHLRKVLNVDIDIAEYETVALKEELLKSGLDLVASSTLNQTSIPFSISEKKIPKVVTLREGNSLNSLKIEDMS